METNMPKPVKQKQLAQLLQEQQEPFTLEVYLLERGYLKNGSKFFNKIKKGIPYCSKIMRAVFNKLILINESSTPKPSNHKNGNFFATQMGRNSHEVAELDRFSSTNSCSERLTEAVTGRMFQKRKVHEDGKQLSPVSVLEEIPSDDGSPIRNNNTKFRAKQKKGKISSNKVTDGGCKLSASLWKLLIVHSPVAELQESTTEFNTSSHCLKSRRALQARKQLFFDCIEEEAETHQRKERKLKFLGHEQLEKTISEKIKNWGKQSGDETSITQILNFDYSASAQEWREFEQENRGIAVEIGDAILEEIAHEIIVTDMVGLIDIFCTNSKECVTAD